MPLPEETAIHRNRDVVSTGTRALFYAGTMTQINREIDDTTTTTRYQVLLIICLLYTSDAADE